MLLGLGLLGAFFIGSGVIIYYHNSARTPPSSSSLNREAIEGMAPTSATPGASAVGFVLNEFHRSSVKDGKVAWEIFGKRGRYDALNNNAEVEQPRLTVNRPNGDTVNLTAGKANLQLSGTELLGAELIDHVLVIFKGETTITTSKAIYKKDTETVEIPNPVEVENPLFSLRGQKLFGKLNDQEFTMTNGVKTTLKPRKK
jgi:LPS export ABC transporter protein LptC